VAQVDSPHPSPACLISLACPKGTPRRCSAKLCGDSTRFAQATFIVQHHVLAIAPGLVLGSERGRHGASARDAVEQPLEQRAHPAAHRHPAVVAVALQEGLHVPPDWRLHRRTSRGLAVIDVANCSNDKYLKMRTAILEASRFGPVEGMLLTSNVRFIDNINIWCAILYAEFCQVATGTGSGLAALEQP
jgi:hypothetical protein